MKRRLSLVPAIALGIALTYSLHADTPVQTEPRPEPSPAAFALINKGNDYVGVQSKDKVIGIDSDKSLGSLRPNIWRITYYDPDTAMKSVEVKFGGGQEMEVSHPVRPLEFARNARNGGEILDRSKLHIDSDQALSIATDQGLVKPLALKATRLTLTSGDLGPVWKVEMWAARMDKPDKEVSLGTVTLSATDGTIVRLDLHPDRVR